jgi:SAM-dependent methyltransferase
VSAGWDHNTHYHSVLLAALPVRCRAALDVGCGEGRFARLLAERVEQVDAIDRDPAVLARARRFSRGITNVRFVSGDFLAEELAPESHDFVSAIAVVHHVPFTPAMQKLRALLRPGGVLAVLGLHRSAGVTDLVQSLVAFPVSRILRVARGPAGGSAPLRDPTMTFPEIRAEASAALPGCVVRRHLLWRYSLLWTKPRGSTR